MSPLSTPKSRSLASRLVLLGIVQLALITLTAIGIFIAQGPYGEPRPEDHVDLRKLEMLTSTPDALGAELEHLRQERIEISLYDMKRQLIATNVDPPLAIPARWNRERGGPPRPPGDVPGDAPVENRSPTGERVPGERPPPHEGDGPSQHGEPHPPTEPSRDELPPPPDGAAPAPGPDRHGPPP